MCVTMEKGSAPQLLVALGRLLISAEEDPQWVTGKTIDGEKMLDLAQNKPKHWELRPMFRAVKSNSLFIAPRDVPHALVAVMEAKAFSYQSPDSHQ